MKLKCEGVCTKVLNKSTSPAFKGLQVGDTINFSVEIQRAGRRNDRRSGSYATYILCENPKTKETSILSFNQLARVMNNFEFEEK